MQENASKRLIGGSRLFRRLSHTLDMCYRSSTKRKIVSIRDGLADMNWKSLEEVDLISFGDEIIIINNGIIIINGRAEGKSSFLLW